MYIIIKFKAYENTLVQFKKASYSKMGFIQTYKKCIGKQLTQLNICQK